ncbi:hypothetical protein CARUB_v10003905mg [Capsella rubella]|uniref:Uncharacterized protein n=1 Tax=Capsella rubella TaxID=81985 RepID=R0FKY2_9BRAS|nr:hypothetical protein CARUB_v10003905mg [Capsella rubella]
MERKLQAEYWKKKWEKKRQGEDSELERGPMEEEDEAEKEDGKFWGIKDKISHWEEQIILSTTAAKYWELMYGYLGLSN